MQAGFARVEITPRKGEHPEMMGFGPFLGRTALEVLQPLYLRSSYLRQDNGRAALLLSFDVCGLDESLADEIRAASAKAVGLKAEQVIATCTHTHSAPAVMTVIGWGEFDDATAKRLPRQAAKAARAAQEAAGEVTLESGISQLNGFSRNRVYGPSGPRDTRVRVLAFRRAVDGAIAGLWAHFACHPVILCEQCRVISPDYCGVAMQALEEQHPGAVCSFLQGADGDINPLWAHMEQERSIVHLAHAAYRFRSAVEAAMAECVPVGESDVVVASDRLTLPVQILSDDTLEAFSANARLAPEEGWRKLEAISRVKLDEDAAVLRRRPTPAREVPIAALRVGDHTLVFHPFEMFTRLGWDVCEGLTGETTWVVGYTNHFIGYAPTPDRFAPMSGDYAAHGVPLMRGRHPFTAALGPRLVAGLAEIGRRVQPQISARRRGGGASSGVSSARRRPAPARR